ncbi:site-specific integrase [Vagococcus fluvialis]|uniref:tyrosine-type recombinase/integrase n=1 Tax=Vagococcus fluvialis TaxID=2738 RepID=UPI0032E479E9
MAKITKYTDKKGNTAYKFQIYLGINPLTGKPQKTTRAGFRTQKEATLMYSKLKLEAEQGLLTKPKEVPTFKNLYESWFETHKLSIKPNTQDSVETIFRVRILPHFGHFKVDKITPIMCQKVLNSWAMKYRSFNENKIRFDMVMNYGIKMGYLDINPMSRVNVPKSQVPALEKTGSFLTKEELEQYLIHFKEECDTKMFTFFRVISFTGIRKGEALALTWEDIDFNNGTIRIEKTAYYNAGKRRYNVDTPKTSSSVRTIKLDEPTISILKAWKIEQREILLASGIRVDSPKKFLVFPKMTPRRELEYLNNSTPNRILDRIIKKYNLTPITVHGFRHTHATLLAEAGVSPNATKQRLGHEKIETTLGIYTHVTPDMQTGAVQQLQNHVNF